MLFTDLKYHIKKMNVTKYITLLSVLICLNSCSVLTKKSCESNWWERKHNKYFEEMNKSNRKSKYSKRKVRRSHKCTRF